MPDYERVEINDMVKMTLSLSRNEALYIDDSLSLMVERTDADRMIGTMRLLLLSAPMGAPLDLIEKITYAVLYTTDDANQAKEAQVEVTEEDIYILREIAQSYIKVGSEAVGFNLKRKLYNLLHSSYTSDAEWDKVLASFDSRQARLENIIETKKKQE
tara:strand:- start:493 stop:966 length:474 start_codon:yes stop_codon:yes gene_type:complete